MDFEIDNTPPPAPTSLRANIAAIEAGQSLKTRRHSMRVVAVSTSHVRKAHPDRTFKIAEDGDGVRVWRLS